MKMAGFLTRRCLVILAGEKGLVIGEWSPREAGRRSPRLFTWALPDETGDPLAAGRALRAFLRARRLAPAPVVFGLPARWLLARSKQVPATDAASLAGLLRLEAERDFALPPEELVADYLPGAAGGDRRQVLVVAVRRARVDFFMRLAAGAGLKVRASLPLLLALEHAGERTGDGFLVYLGAGGAEAALYSGGQPCLLRHLGPLPLPGETPGEQAVFARRARELGGELERLLLLAPRAGDGPGPREILLCDDSGLPADAREALVQALPLPVRVTAAPGRLPTPGRGGPGTLAALALGGAAAAGRPPFDFQHSRLVERLVSGRRRLFVRALPGVAAAGLLLGAGWHDLAGRQRRVAELNQRLEALRPEMETARAVLGYTDSLREWQAVRSPFLECLRAVTLVFPPEGGIWTTSLSVRENMRALLSGKADDSGNVLAVLDRLRAGESFREVELVYIRSAGRGVSEVTWAINFIFDPVADRERAGEAASR